MIENFFLLGYYGWNNTGDDAMIYSLLHVLWSNFKGSKFTILSRNPVMVPPSVKKAVKFVSSEAPFQVLWEIMHSSIFILGGGTHLYDYGKKENRIRRLSQMLLLVLFARVFCKEVYFICIGIEAPTTSWGKILIKNICRLADQITVRDSFSYNVLCELKLKDKCVQSLDLGLLLDNSSACKKTYLEKKRILGVSILPFFEIYYCDKEIDKLFLQNIAEGLNHWLKNDIQSLIYLFVFKGKSKDDDVFITHELKKLLNSSDRVKIIDYNPNPIETLCKVAECNAFIGMRYHSCVYAYISDLPILVIDYAEKNRALARDIGLNESAIISLESVLNGYFTSYINNLQIMPKNFRAELPKEIAKDMVKKHLKELFDESIKCCNG